MTTGESMGRFSTFTPSTVAAMTLPPTARLNLSSGWVAFFKLGDRKSLSLE